MWFAAPVAVSAPLLTATLAPERSEVALGEPVWMRLLVTNRTGREVTVVVGPRLAGSGLGVAAIGPDGQPAPDPFHQHRVGGWFGGLEEVTVPDGGVAAVRFDLSDFAWLDEPGTWSVRAFPRISTSPRTPPATDPRWATTTVRVVAAGPGPRPGPGSGAAWARPGWMVGLAGRAMEADPQARAALDACPCPEATSVLLSLLDHRRVEVRHWAANALTTRLPGDPAWAGFTARAWDDATREEAARRAAAVRSRSDPDPELAAWANAVGERLP